MSSGWPEAANSSAASSSQRRAASWPPSARAGAPGPPRRRLPCGAFPQRGGSFGGGEVLAGVVEVAGVGAGHRGGHSEHDEQKVQVSSWPRVAMARSTTALALSGSGAAWIIVP